MKRQRREANLETSEVDDVLEAGEVLLDQMERDVVRDVELEQEFSHLMEEENNEQVNPKNTSRSANHKDENQARDRRQTSDPDQLCPTLATFVMPRAGLNAQGSYFLFPLLSCLVQDSMPKVQPLCAEPPLKQYFSSGNWMYIVNMPDDTQYQQFVRSEVCM